MRSVPATDPVSSSAFLKSPPPRRIRSWMHATFGSSSRLGALEITRGKFHAFAELF
jgi:hypothetical protein